jgi:hypothetical protein
MNKITVVKKHLKEDMSTWRKIAQRYPILKTKALKEARSDNLLLKKLK